MRFIRLAVCLLSLGPIGVLAAGTEKSGVRPNAITLPSGPGSVQGLGSAFEPNLNRGSGSYDVPLRLPEGTAGVTPSLSLVYDSGHGNGPVGMGWRLGGLQEVSRRTDRGVPRYDDTDTFVLDGRVLVPVGQDHYRLEREAGFLRLQRHGDGHWEALEPGGRRLVFGQSPDARVAGPDGTLAWRLEAIVDPTGQRILFDWTHEGGQAYLSRVRYTVRPETSDHEVHFAYESRPDVRTDHRGGFPVTTARRLSAIGVLGNGRPLWTYELEYADGSALSRLTSLRMVAADGTGLPSLTFGYTEVGLEAVGVVSVSDAPGADWSSGNVTVTDLYGDGLPDILEAQAGQHRVWRNLGGRFAEVASLPFSPSVELASAGVSLADVDGSGRADLLAKSDTAFRWFPNEGGHWGGSVEFDEAPPFGLTDPNVRVYDYDGDGLSDLVQTTATSWYWWRNTGDGTWEGPMTAQPPEAGLDLSDPAVRLADFDGDGLVDVGIVRSGTVRYWPYLGYGRFGEQVVLANAPVVDDEPSSLHMVDVDGDGLPDLVHVGVTRVTVWLQRHGGFSEPVVIEGTPDRSLADTTVQMLDINGDGGTNVVYARPNATDPADRLVYVDFGNGQRPNLLERIDNGLGGVTRLRYAPAALLAAQDAEDGRPWQSVAPMPVQVITEMIEEDSLGWQRRTTYHYRDAYYDPIDRAFRGFERVEAIHHGDETAEGLVRDLTFDLGWDDPVREGRLLEEVLRSTEGKRYQETHHVLEVAELAQGTDGTPVRWAYVASTEVHHYEGESDPRIVLTEYDYDGHGNLVAEYAWGEVIDGEPEAGGDVRISRTDWLVDEDRWLMLPYREVVEDAEGTVWSRTRTHYDGLAFEGLPLGEADVGLVTRVSQWLGPNDDRWVDVERYDRDAFGNVVAVLDPEGGRTDHVWDPETHGFLVAERVHVGAHIIEFTAEYDPGLGVLTAVRYPSGEITRYRYDGLGRLVAVIRPGDSEDLPTARYAYLLEAPVSSVTTHARRISGESEEDVERSFFDGLGRPRGTVVRLGPGEWVLSGYETYDARGNARDRYQAVRRSEGALGPVPGTERERTVYDALGRPVAHVFPDGTARISAYGPLSSTELDEAAADAASPHSGQALIRHYDGLGRLRVLEKRTRDGGRTVESIYDPLGNRVGYVDASGHRREMHWDALGRLVALEDPDFGHHTLERDAAGRIVRQVDPMGRVMRIAYDEAGRPLWQDRTGDGSPDVEWVYDHRDDAEAEDHLLGRIALIRDDLGEVRFRYAPRGLIREQERVTEEERYRSRFVYDAQDRPIARTFPDGTTLRYEYDARGLLVHVPGFVRQEFDEHGLLRARITGDGVTTERAYDRRLRLIAERTEAPDGTRLRDLSYERDPVGNPLQIHDHRSDVAPDLSRGARFQYDDLYRVTSAELTGGTVSWAYGPSGLLRDRDGSGLDADLAVSGLVYGEGAGPHALTRYGDRVLSYDGAGRLVDDGLRRYHWDAAGQLVEIELEDGGRVRHLYGHDGGRVLREHIGSRGETVESTIYLDAMQEIQDGRVVKYVLAGSDRVARVEEGLGEAGGHDVSRSWLGLFVLLGVALGLGIRRTRTLTGLMVLFVVVASCRQPDEELDEFFEGRITFLHPDAMGNIDLATRDGEVVHEQAHRPFGSVRGERGTIADDYGYSGKEVDAATGLVYFGQRYYDPELSRWISPDPLLLSDPDRLMEVEPFSNPYAYVSNRPTVAVDLEGLEMKISDHFSMLTHDYGMGAGCEYKGGCQVGVHVGGALAKADTGDVSVAKGKYGSVDVRAQATVGEMSAGVKYHDGKVKGGVELWGARAEASAKACTFGVCVEPYVEAGSGVAATVEMGKKTGVKLGPFGAGVKFSRESPKLYRFSDEYGKQLARVKEAMENGGRVRVRTSRDVARTPIRSGGSGTAGRTPVRTSNDERRTPVDAGRR